MRNKLLILQNQFGKEIDIDRRNAAEYAYAIALIAAEAKNEELAAEFAIKAIELFENVGIETLEDAIARNHFIEDISIPDLIHEDVVKARFSHILQEENV